MTNALGRMHWGHTCIGPSRPVGLLQNTGHIPLSSPGSMLGWWWGWAMELQKYIRARSLPRCTCLPHSTCMVTGKDAVSLASNAGCSWHQEGTESGLESPLGSVHWWPKLTVYSPGTKSPKDLPSMSLSLLWVQNKLSSDKWREAPRAATAQRKCARGMGPPWKRWEALSLYNNWIWGAGSAEWMGEEDTVDGTEGASTWENGRGRAIPAPPHPKGHTSRPLREVWWKAREQEVGGAVFSHALEGSAIFLYPLAGVIVDVQGRSRDCSFLWQKETSTRIVII